MVLAALLAGGALAWFATAPDDRVEGQTSSPAAGSAAPASPTASEQSPSSTSSPTSSSSSPATTPSPTDALTRLGELRTQSLSRYAPDGRYVVVLSAKADGTEDPTQRTASGSHVFRLPDILDLHEKFADYYEGSGTVYLLKASDVGSSADGPRADELWMTVLDPGGLETREDALEWCARDLPELSAEERLNVCYPRELDAP